MDKIGTGGDWGPIAGFGFGAGNLYGHRWQKHESGNFSRTFSRTFSSPPGKDPRKMGDFALSENPPKAANRGFTD